MKNLNAITDEYVEQKLEELFPSQIELNLATASDPKTGREKGLRCDIYGEFSHDEYELEAINYTVWVDEKEHKFPDRAAALKFYNSVDLSVEADDDDGSPC
jgi:hypothetical protein